MPSAEDWELILRRALRADVGIAVASSNPETDLRSCQIAIRNINDGEMKILRVERSRTSPGTEIWITKRGADAEDS